MPTQVDVITGSVTKNTDVQIRRLNDTDILNQPLYAINWFSTKIEWLYHFYNLVALRSVKRVGGKVFFKGKLYKKLVGVPADERQLLLIVRYPDATHFRDLMIDTYFKVVSIFRILSVEKFSFGFTEKYFPAESYGHTNKQSVYAIHHFKSAQTEPDLLLKIQDIMSPFGVQLFYYGKMEAQLYSKEKNKEPEQIPNLMDGLFLLESETEEKIVQLINDETYQKIISDFDSSFIGLLNRTR